MIGIRNIASYVPANFESNYDKKALFEIDDDFIRNKIGVEKVSRMGPGEDTSGMCVRAFKRLQANTGLSVGDIQCLIVCTQNPDNYGIPHTSALVHAELGLSDDCAAFDISLGCSGYVYSLSIARAFMESNGLKTGLLFTADPYSKVLDPADKNTVLLFGDGATVTLLADDSNSGGCLWLAKHFFFGTRGKEGAALQNKTGRLEMNGRAVFNFSATVVPAQVKKLLVSAGLTADDIDLFVFHQGSKYIIDTLIRRMDLPADKVPLKISSCGNMVSSSIPFILEDCISRQDISRMLISGFGVGLSWASCVLEKS